MRNTKEYLDDMGKEDSENLEELKKRNVEIKKGNERKNLEQIEKQKEL